MPKDKDQKMTGKEVAEKAIFNALGDKKENNPTPETEDNPLPTKKIHPPKSSKKTEKVDAKMILNFENGKKDPSEAPKKEKKEKKVDQKSVLDIDANSTPSPKKEKKPEEKVDQKNVLDFKGEFQEHKARILRAKEMLKKTQALLQKNNRDLKMQRLPDKSSLQFSFEEKVEEYSFASYSPTRRILHITGAFLVAGFFLGITFFLGGSALKDAKENTNEIVGPRSQVLLTTGEDFFVSNQAPLFGGEEIKAGEEGATINFFEGSSVRLTSDTDVKILSLRPSPNIQVISGKAWIFGQRSLQITTEDGLFSAESTSALVTADERKTTIASFRHSLFGEVWSDKNPKRTEVIIPSGREITLFLGALPDTHDEIRFSKLKKELHFANAKSDSWTDKNLRIDRQELLRSTRLFRPEHIGSIGSDDFWGAFKASFTFFEEKREIMAKNEWDNRQNAFLEEYIFGGQSLGVMPQEVEKETLEDALFLAGLMPPDPRLLQKTEEIETELTLRSTTPETRRIISKSRFALLENALKRRDIDSAGKVVARIKKTWEQSTSTPQNRTALDLDRENLAVLLQKNKNQTSGAIFLAMADLDAIAVSWENESPSVVALEMANKNFSVIDAFLKKADFNTAKKLLDLNAKYLNITPEKNLLAAYEESHTRQNYLTDKYEIFKERGVLTDERLHAVMKSRANVEEAINQFQEEQKKLLEQLALESTQQKETLEEKVRKDFSENNITIISLVGADEGAESVEIAEGILPDKTHFSAEYYPEEKILNNITVADEDIAIAKEVPIGQFITAIENLRSINAFNPKTLEDIVNQSADGWKDTSEDLLKDVDPVEISINKIFVQKEIEKGGMSAELRDIVMINRNTISVHNVKYTEKGEYLLDFSYNLNAEDSKKVSNVLLMPENRKIAGEFSLEKLRRVAQEEEEKVQKEKDFAKKVEWELLRVGIDINEKKITVRNGLVSFSNGVFGNRKISGLADISAGTFMMVKDQNGILFQNIAFSDFAEKILTLPEKETSD